MKKLYLAGSLFTQSEVAQRIKEGKQIKEKTFFEVYNPIEAPCNDKDKLPTAKQIFWGDTEEVLKSDIVIADISNPNDMGVACELGITWTCNYIHELALSGKTLEDILEIMKRKRVVAHLSDIRKATAHRYEGNYVPVGFNQYMIGLIEDVGVIKDNFEEALDELI